MMSHGQRVSRLSLPAFCALVLASFCASGARADATIPEATRVATAQALKTAVEDGAAHIRITDHLDATGLPGLANSAPFFKLFNPGPDVKSITGDCPTPPKTKAPKDLRPGQCVIDADLGVFGWYISPAADDVWLDGMYIRVTGVNSTGAQRVQGPRACAALI